MDKMRIYIFAKDNNNGDLIKTFINIIDPALEVVAPEQNNDNISGEKKAKDFLEKLEDGKISEQNMLCIYHISKDDFIKASANGFQFKNNSDDQNSQSNNFRSFGHPLYFRYSRQEFENIKASDKNRDKTHSTISQTKKESENKETTSLNYQSFCFPILYITNFDFLEKADYSFLDSSIWHRAIQISENSSYFKEKLKDRLQNFIEWHKQKLYKRIVAIEVLDYHIRMFREQRLTVLGEVEGHAKYINLGFWRSESECEKAFKENFKDPYPRRFLLVDDYADEELRIFKEYTKEEDTKGINQESVGNNVSKKYLIEKILLKIYKSKDAYELHFATDIEEAIKKILKTHYDIILLDYRLKGKSKGTELLNELSNLKEKKNLMMGKYWIFSESAFSEAMFAEVTSGKVQARESAYILHPGADPVNTPHLFCLNLYNFLKTQENETCSFRTIEALSKEIFLPTTNVPAYALEIYHTFLDIMNTYEQLHKKKDESLLAKHVMDNVEINDALWGHLHHLIFMLGHEPSSEWAKMWDEFNIVEKKIRKIDDSGNTSYLEPIREYIIDLQRTSRGLT